MPRCSYLSGSEGQFLTLEGVDVNLTLSRSLPASKPRGDLGASSRAAEGPGPKQQQQEERQKGRKEEAILSGAGLLHEQLLDMGRSGPGGRRRMCRDRTKRKGTTVIMAGFALAELTREIPQGRREEFFFLYCCF